MAVDTNTKPQRLLSVRLSIGFALAAAVLGVAALYRTNHYPRTDDAAVFANFIGIAPQVDGPVIRLNVRDNQFVKKGELLYEVDDRPYQYAVETAISNQEALEGQIVDEQRRIAALVSAVSVSQAKIHSAQADVANSAQGVNRVRAEGTYASNNLHRLEPLLTKQFVTVDQVDRAKTSEITQSEALKQAESQLLIAQAGVQSALAQYERSQSVVDESKAYHEQAQHAVTTLEPLVKQRGAHES